MPTEPPRDDLAPIERPVAEIDATDELLDDPTLNSRGGIAPPLVQPVTGGGGTSF